MFLNCTGHIQVLNSDLWLMTITVDSTDGEHVHHHRNFHRTTLSSVDLAFTMHLSRKVGVVLAIRMPPASQASLLTQTVGPYSSSST